MIFAVLPRYDLVTKTLHDGRSHASSGNEETNGTLTLHPATSFCLFLLSFRILASLCILSSSPHHVYLWHGEIAGDLSYPVVVIHFIFFEHTRTNTVNITGKQTQQESCTTIQSLDITINLHRGGVSDECLLKNATHHASWTKVRANSLTCSTTWPSSTSRELTQ